jgi:hypothetical protein
MVHHLAALVFAVDDYEPSKVPFYIGGGVLALWAVFLGFVGLRTENFPESALASRAVMGVSAVLVVFAIATALITA